jgi:hypothetical protein
MTTRNCRNSCAALALFVALGLPASAAALLGDREGPVALDGSVRTLSAATHNYGFAPLFGDHGGDGISQSLLRLTATGHPLAWLRLEVHGVQSLEYSTMSSGGGLSLPGFGSAAVTRYRALDASTNWAGAPLVARLWLDRCNFQIGLPFADLTVGRQAINFGQAYFFNPLDVFLPFDPRQFDRDYKAGVDALRLDIPLGDFAGINLVAAAGRSLLATSDEVLAASWYGSAVLARLFFNLGGFDWSFQGGKVYGGYQIGGGFTGEVGPLQLRGELAWLRAVDAPELPAPWEGKEVFTHWSGVLGVGHRFENSLNLQSEYLHNGLADPDDLETAFYRQGQGLAPHARRHIFGMMASYDILPILTGSLAWIVSASDASGLLQPGLVLSVADEADLVAGAMIAFGKRPDLRGASTPLGLRSEFGTYPDIFYLQFKLYF